MNIKLLSVEEGKYTFNITNAGSITSVTVPENIMHGDVFSISYGDGHYMPHRKKECLWLGGEANGRHLIGDVEKSILESEVYIGESVDSDAFYESVSQKYCKCICNEPVIADPTKNMVLAVDLSYPEYGRNSSRMIVFINKCAKCTQSLTYGSSIGSFHTKGLDSLKLLAEQEARKPIDWDLVITSIDQI